MRPIPAPRIGDSHGLLRAIDERERLRLDEFVTEFSVDDLYPPGLENALGRTRQFISYARAAGLVKEDRGIVELTEVGRRYIRAGDPSRPFDVASGQADWLRRQLGEKHMTDSIYHGLAIALSLLASSPGARVATLDFGRALSYLGRAGWDNENTLQIQGERHLTLLRDMELVDGERALTELGTTTKAELTLPIHMSLTDLAAQLNPGGAEAVRAAGEAESGAPVMEPLPPPERGEDDGYTDVGPGAWAEPAAAAEPAPVDAEPAPVTAEPEPGASRPVVPADVWEIAAPDDATRAITAVPPPEPEPVAPEPAAAAPEAAPQPDVPAEPAAVPRTDAPTVIARPRVAFLAGSAIRAAAARRGLELGDGVYANVAAALAGGRHVLLVGPPESGKTELALAIAHAAVVAGKATGMTLLVGEGQVVGAAQAGRWLVIDELAGPPASSALLAHLPVTLDNGEEVTAPETWRIVATARTAPLDLSRFAIVDVGPHPNLAKAIDAAAEDPIAAAAAKRLLPLAELTPLGAGPFLAAANHAAARRAESPADERTLAREIYAAYFAPLLGDLDSRAREIVG
jgi:hypothetical protein